ncbi:ABC-type Fe3+/spermidine/putrescine transport system ATPase subunit [Pedobacter sp. CG_S7]|uniref:ABC transporter ATP-binding protein n=1 Tax=Pedobacter sp. CG_S7 TaxID=3143930 RepID=UPI00339B03B0
MESKPLIQFKNCTKRYGGKTILRNISFEVDEGSAFISILGKSGCGKTTLLRLLAGLEKPEEGKISINGKIVSDGNKIIVPPHQRNIGFVFQDLALWPHFTVHQNIEFGLKQLQIAGYKNLINQTLEEFGIAELKNNFPHQLSGGQQQLVALARSMVLQPRILLMDEPLANLDVKLKTQIRTLVKQLVKEKDMTVLYVTHDHKEAVDLSNKIMLLNSGIINYYGTTTEMHQSNDPFVKEFIEI